MSHTCPQCGGPGGVLLLFTVAPCDRCSAKPAAPTMACSAPGIVSGTYTWINFHTPVGGSMPHWPMGTIFWEGWLGYLTDEDIRDSVAKKRLPDPGKLLNLDIDGDVIKGNDLRAMALSRSTLGSWKRAGRSVSACVINDPDIVHLISYAGRPALIMRGDRGVTVPMQATHGKWVETVDEIVDFDFKLDTHILGALPMFDSLRNGDASTTGKPFRMYWRE